MGDAGGKAKVVERLTVFFLYLMLAFPVPTYAHPDFLIVEKTLTVAAGNFIEFRISVHFHRLVGTFEVVEPASGIASILLLDDQNFAKLAAGMPITPLYSSSPSNKGILNHLIACCIGSSWTGYHVIVDNRHSNSGMIIRVSLRLLHDDIAVIAYDAEPGAAITSGGLGLVIGAIISLYVTERVKGNTSFVGNERLERKKSLATVASAILFGSASILGLGVAILGASSYGGSLIDGLVAGVSYLNLPQGPFGSTFSVLIGILFLLWLFGLLFWMREFSVTVGSPSKILGVLGAIQGAGTLLVGSLIYLNYGFSPFVIVVAISLGTPQILGSLYLTQRAISKSNRVDNV